MLTIDTLRNQAKSNFNLVTGYIPPNLGWCQSLTYLDGSQNHLIGSIPSSIGDLKRLQTLIFDHNQLTGEPCDTQTKLSNQILPTHN